ncbi:hypothetical protein OH77DRAFT_1431401 [Trametes cingulata]|nr:hypothetical protein OH77DRAFT_1431401 [Trametes cingulata]
MKLDPLRFAEVGSIRFYYVTEDADGQLVREELVRNSSNNVLVETLPTGAWGLPLAIVSKLTVDEVGIDILHPSILILTKFNRWSLDYTSTRPKTVRKVASDRGDIRFLIKWLAENSQQIQFDEYRGKTRPQLLTMIRKYHDKYHNDTEHMAMLRSIMRDHWDDMLALPKPEVESRVPP